MAKETNAALQKQVIYSVYVRNHTPEGTFAAVAGDLDRITRAGYGHNMVHADPPHRHQWAGRVALGCPVRQP